MPGTCLTRPTPRRWTVDYYEDLMLRAASALLQPFGVSEEDLRVSVRADLGEQLSLPLHAWNRRRTAAENTPVYALSAGL